MCRMLAMVSNDRITDSKIDFLWTSITSMAKDITTTHEFHLHAIGPFDIFEKGTFTHGDGWGIAYVDKSGKIKGYHSMTQIWEDKLPDDVHRDLTESKAVIVHARKASPGLDKTLNYLHPFIRDGNGYRIAFAHNGTIKERETIQYDSKYKLSVDSDTERFTYAIMTELDKGRSELNAFRDVVTSLPPSSSANYLSFVTREETTKFLASMNFQSKLVKYLTMQYIKKDGDLIVASERLAGIDGDWQEFKQSKILCVDINK